MDGDAGCGAGWGVSAVGCYEEAGAALGAIGEGRDDGIRGDAVGGDGCADVVADGFRRAGFGRLLAGAGDWGFKRLDKGGNERWVGDVVAEAFMAKVGCGEKLLGRAQQAGGVIDNANAGERRCGFRQRLPDTETFEQTDRS